MNHLISKFPSSEVDSILEGVQFAESLKNPIHLVNGTDLNTIKEAGCYSSWDSANTNTLINTPSGIFGGFNLVVLRGGTNNATVYQVIIPNSDGAVFFRKLFSTATGEWYKAETVLATYKTSGQTSQRVDPVHVDGRSIIGDMFFDTTIGQPVFWSGDTTKGDHGWVDANGGNPYAQQ